MLNLTNGCLNDSDGVPIPTDYYSLEMSTGEHPMVSGRVASFAGMHHSWFHQCSSVSFEMDRIEAHDSTGTVKAISTGKVWIYFTAPVEIDLPPSERQGWPHLPVQPMATIGNWEVAQWKADSKQVEAELEEEYEEENQGDEPWMFE